MAPKLRFRFAVGLSCLFIFFGQSQDVLHLATFPFVFTGFTSKACESLYLNCNWKYFTELQDAFKPNTGENIFNDEMNEALELLRGAARTLGCQSFWVTVSWVTFEPINPAMVGIQRMLCALYPLQMDRTSRCLISMRGEALPETHHLQRESTRYVLSIRD